MSPKKSPIKPEKREEWLRRIDEGESAVRIAKVEKVDPRTVRSNVEAARQERETKDARSLVLRNALERHYEDLVRYAQRLADETSAEEMLPYESQLNSALRQHLTKSRIWRWLSDQAKLEAEVPVLTKRLENKIRDSISTDSNPRSQLETKDNNTVSGIIQAVIYRVLEYAQGHDLSDIDHFFVSEEVGKGFFDVRHGSIPLGKVMKVDVIKIRSNIVDWTDNARRWPEYRDLEKVFHDIPRIRQSLKDEIAVIVLRRVVPGRCRYCPI
jgi:hypothetical protein